MTGGVLPRGHKVVTHSASIAQSITESQSPRVCPPTASLFIVDAYMAANETRRNVGKSEQRTQHDSRPPLGGFTEGAVRPVLHHNH